MKIITEEHLAAEILKERKACAQLCRDIAARERRNAQTENLEDQYADGAMKCAEQIMLRSATTKEKKS